MKVHANGNCNNSLKINHKNVKKCQFNCSAFAISFLSDISFNNVVRKTNSK